VDLLSLEVKCENRSRSRSKQFTALRTPKRGVFFPALQSCTATAAMPVASETSNQMRISAPHNKKFWAIASVFAIMLTQAWQ
jgi:hypothetical protein